MSILHRLGPAPGLALPGVGPLERMTFTSHQKSEKMSLSELLFSFDGRISRSTYWLKFALPLAGFGLVAAILDMAMGTFDYENNIGLLSGLLSLAAIYPSVAVGVKRCHDRDRSGWFILIGLIPIVQIWLWIELGVLKGTTGRNQYGADPLLL